MKSNLTTALVLSLGAALVGCGPIKNMDEMKNTTNAMNENMKSMNGEIQATNKTTGKLADETSDLKETNEAMFEDLQQGSALTLRRDAMDRIAKPSAMPEKLVSGAAYFRAFEYGLLREPRNTEEAPAVAEKYESLLAEALEELAFDLKPLILKERAQAAAAASANPMEPTDAGQSLEAIALASHEVNANAKAREAKGGRKARSLLSVVVEALTAESDIEKGVKSASPAEHVVLANKGVFARLLQVRERATAIVGLARITGVASFAQLDFTKVYSLVGKTSAELEEVAKALGASLQMRQTLAALGLPGDAAMAVLKGAAAQLQVAAPQAVAGDVSSVKKAQIGALILGQIEAFKK